MCCDYFISLNGIYNNPTLFILQHFLLRIETFRQKLGTITKILYNYNLYLYKILLYVKKYLIMYNINGEEKI